jgi:hypothetical protein
MEDVATLISDGVSAVVDRNVHSRVAEIFEQIMTLLRREEMFV